jgi:hemerythrin-like domain-containing protein
MSRTLNVIRDEHRALASVMKGLQFLVAQTKERKLKPDFSLLQALVRYIEQYPDRLHHPKEDQLLFPVLRERDPSAAPILDELESQHRQGPAVIAEVSRALVRWKSDATALDDFAAAVERYAEFQWCHMRLEETEVLPRAQQTLLPSDWVRIDQAFGENGDPLVGVGTHEEFRELFRHVVNAMPAPMGLGPEAD